MMHMAIVKKRKRVFFDVTALVRENINTNIRSLSDRTKDNE